MDILGVQAAARECERAISATIQAQLDAFTKLTGIVVESVHVDLISTRTIDGRGQQQRVVTHLRVVI